MGGSERFEEVVLVGEGVFDYGLDLELLCVEGLEVLLVFSVFFVG